MAFSPRTKASLGIPTRAEPVSDSRLEARSFFRQAPCSYRDKPPNTAQHRLWLDISTIDIADMEKMDKDYNSNLWKNFRFVRSGKKVIGSGSKPKTPIAVKVDYERDVRDGVANNYPLKIPKPSRVGDNTYEKFVDQATFKDEKRKRIRLHTNKTRVPEKRELKIRSECRAPPLDWDGNIMPPAGYRKYPKFIEWEEQTETRPLPYTTHLRDNPKAGSHDKRCHSYSNSYRPPSWQRGRPPSWL